MNRLLFMFAMLCAFGCSTDIDVYAPEREVYVVWGVLNPTRSEQFIKVSQVFQSEGDAVIFANQNDLSAQGLEVFLTGDGLSLQAEPTLVDRGSEGLFSETHILYRFETTGANALQGGKRYELEIRKPDDDEFKITAWTEIPTTTFLRNPSGPVYVPDQQLYLYPSLNFDSDYVTYFKKGSGKGFEVRVWVDYEENGVAKSAHWGPSPIFTKPVRCGPNNQRDEMCYEIPMRTVPNAFKNIFKDNPNIVLNDSIKMASTLDSLSRVIRFEITSIDSFLTSYLYANSPFGFGLNLLMDKPQISNISGEHIGIFGSIHPHHRYINFGACAKYWAGLASFSPALCD